MNRVRIMVGDVFGRLAELPDESMHCVVTSPPYWGLRVYGGEEKMIGLEATFDAHLDVLVRVFREVRRVLRPDGTLWLNYGDAYAGVRPATGLAAKQLLMMPTRIALALQADGWWVRAEIIWFKQNSMPESVTDRPTSAHEKIFLLSKRAHYFYDADAVRTPSKREPNDSKTPDGWGTGPGGHGSIHRQGREKGESKKDKQRGHSRRHAGFNDRWDAMTKAEQQAMGANLRNVWMIPAFGYPDAHFATFPPALVEPSIKAGTSARGCCSTCGAPFTRNVRKEYRNPGYRTTNGPRSVDRHHETAGFEKRLEASYRSEGWQPGCTCDAGEPVPAVVLDPFAGTGTTGLVADRLGRGAILIELNPEYAEMARRRIHEDAPLFTDVQVDKESHETARLFAN